MAISNTLVQTIPTQVFLATGEQAVTTIVACNVSTTATTSISLFAVPYGSNAGPSTQIISRVSLPPGETFSLDSERFVLEDADAFYAQATIADIVCITISSVATT
jgi:hypothetical protein